MSDLTDNDDEQLMKKANDDQEHVSDPTEDASYGKVREGWQIHNDGLYAHRLQETEYRNYYDRNKHNNEVLRSDIHCVHKVSGQDEDHPADKSCSDFRVRDQMTTLFDGITTPPDDLLEASDSLAAMKLQEKEVLAEIRHLKRRIESHQEQMALQVEHGDDDVATDACAGAKEGALERMYELDARLAWFVQEAERLRVARRERSRWIRLHSVELERDAQD